MRVVLADDDVPKDAPRDLKPWGKPFLLQSIWQTAFPWADLDKTGVDDPDEPD